MTKSNAVAPSWRVRPRPMHAAALAMVLFLAGCSTIGAGNGASAGTAPGDAAKAARAPQAAPERNPAVFERLQQMSAYLRSLKSFQVTSQTTIDEVLDSGQKVQFGGMVGYRYVAPDKLRAMLRNDRVWRDFYYDGKTITQAAPRMNYYASVPATGSVASLLARLNNDYDIDLPLADLFTWGTSEDSMNSVSSAVLVGPAIIDGADCDHFALRQAGVDWQVWVQRGARPLPRKLLITTTDIAQQPQYTAQLSWFTSIQPRANEFTYVPGKGAIRITQVPAVKPQPPAGAR
ncbi:MAG: DUF2092 domain-containing protein [Proteobacteria bacterium]|nr:DUF2092 domain-containing protein [Pseudomonadota bacterium]